MVFRGYHFLATLSPKPFIILSNEAKYDKGPGDQVVFLLSDDCIDLAFFLTYTFVLPLKLTMGRGIGVPDPIP